MFIFFVICVAGGMSVACEFPVIVHAAAARCQKLVEASCSGVDEKDYGYTKGVMGNMCHRFGCKRTPSRKWLT